MRSSSFFSSTPSAIFMLKLSVQSDWNLSHIMNWYWGSEMRVIFQWLHNVNHEPPWPFAMNLLGQQQNLLFVCLFVWCFLFVCLFLGGAIGIALFHVGFHRVWWPVSIPRSIDGCSLGWPCYRCLQLSFALLSTVWALRPLLLSLFHFLIFFKKTLLSLFLL